jgi:ubiquinol-cytochrome c reductase cytochrome b subunit
MFSAILIILTMAFGDLAKLRGIQFKPLNKAMFFLFVGNLLLLMVLGAKHVESPFIELGQLATLVYFSYFVITVPMSTIFENSINEFYTQIKGKLSKFYKSTQYYKTDIPAAHGFT